MNPHLRNPLRGSMHPWPLARRITDFILRLAAMIFAATNRRVFLHLVHRRTGLTDIRALSAWPRRVAQTLCTVGMLFLLIAFGLVLASHWNAFLFVAAAIACYLMAGAVLYHRAWHPPLRAWLAGVVRRFREVIRNGVP